MATCVSMFVADCEMAALLTKWEAERELQPDPCYVVGPRICVKCGKPTTVRLLTKHMIVSGCRCYMSKAGDD